MKYRILTDRNIGQLILEVNELLASGWQCQGGPCTNVDHTDSTFPVWFSQAMVFDDVKAAAAELACPKCGGESVAQGGVMHGEVWTEIFYGCKKCGHLWKKNPAPVSRGGVNKEGG